MTQNYPSNTSRSAPAGGDKYQVYLLDGHPIEVHVGRKAKGDDLLQEVFNSMNPPLEERDYFSLTFDVLDDKEPIAWLDRGKGVEKQMKKAANPAFAMNVKFFPPDPTTLMEYSRYLFYLQIRDDVAKGKLPCSLSTLALLGSFVCQADQGDYTADMDLSCLQELPLFAPNVSNVDSPILLDRILTLYRTHRGMTTAEAEMNYLEVAKKLTLYGVTLKPCTDAHGTRLYLGVNASGVLVFRDQLRLNRFAWAKIIKISYKKSEFSINLMPGDYDGVDRTVVFKMDSQKEAKSFWKICIEHHQFFRLLSANPKPRKMPFTNSHPTLVGQTEYEIKKSATLNRTDTFARNTVTARRTQTLPAVHHHQHPGMRAPPSPQSGEYEPRRHEQIQSRLSNGHGTTNGGPPVEDGGEHGMNHLYSVPQRVTDEAQENPAYSHSRVHSMNDPHSYSHPHNGPGEVVQHHATVTTTVKTSIRMPPAQPPPRVTNSYDNHPPPASSPPNAAAAPVPPTHITVEQVNGEGNKHALQQQGPYNNQHMQQQPHPPMSQGGSIVATPVSPSDVTSDSDGGEEEELNAPLEMYSEDTTPMITEGAGAVVTHTEQVRTASIVYHHTNGEATEA